MYRITHLEIVVVCGIPLFRQGSARGYPSNKVRSGQTPTTRSYQPIHQMERIVHTKRNLMKTKFFMTTVACMFESFNEISNQWSIVKRKFLWLFCLSSIVVSNASDRRRGHAFYPIITKFKVIASSLLKSRGRSAVCGRSAIVTEFSLLVRNPSAASAITMDSQWAVGSWTVFCNMCKNREI